METGWDYSTPPDPHEGGDDDDDTVSVSISTRLTHVDWVQFKLCHERL